MSGGGNGCGLSMGFGSWDVGDVERSLDGSQKH